MLRGFWLGLALAVAGCGGTDGAVDDSQALGPAGVAGAAGSPTETPTEPAAPTCEAGRQVECPCPNGGKGAQACADDGSKWLECLCADAKPAAPEMSPAEACGPPDLPNELGCPVGKKDGHLKRPCLDAYLESGICVMDAGRVLVCCPAE